MGIRPVLLPGWQNGAETQAQGRGSAEQRSHTVLLAIVVEEKKPLVVFVKQTTTQVLCVSCAKTTHSELVLPHLLLLIHHCGPEKWPLLVLNTPHTPLSPSLAFLLTHSLKETHVRARTHTRLITGSSRVVRDSYGFLCSASISPPWKHFQPFGPT